MYNVNETVVFLFFVADVRKPWGSLRKSLRARTTHLLSTGLLSYVIYVPYRSVPLCALKFPAEGL
jgi:hypothetical protein